MHVLSHRLNLRNLTTKDEAESFEFFKVPTSSYNYIKKTQLGAIRYLYSELLQVVCNNYAVIYEIGDMNNIREINFLKDIHQFTANP